MLPLQTLEILSVLVTFAGILSAMVGSSGMLVLPALLMAGVPPHLALGTNKLYVTSSLFTAAFSYFRCGLFNPRLYIVAAFATTFGAICGVLAAHVLSAELIDTYLPYVIVLMAAYVLLPRNLKSAQKKNKIKEKTKTLRSFWQLLTSLILGIYSGLIGAGTGTLWTSFLVKQAKLELHEANAVSRFMCFIANAVALSVFIYLNEVDYKLGLILAIFGSLGAFIGAQLTVKVKPIVLKVSLVGTTNIMALTLMLT